MMIFNYEYQFIELNYATACRECSGMVTAEEKFINSKCANPAS